MTSPRHARSPFNLAKNENHFSTRLDSSSFPSIDRSIQSFPKTEHRAKCPLKSGKYLTLTPRDAELPFTEWRWNENEEQETRCEMNSMFASMCLCVRATHAQKWLKTTLTKCGDNWTRQSRSTRTYCQFCAVHNTPYRLFVVGRTWGVVKVSCDYELEAKANVPLTFWLTSSSKQSNNGQHTRHTSIRTHTHISASSNSNGGSKQRSFPNNRNVDEATAERQKQQKCQIQNTHTYWASVSFVLLFLFLRFNVVFKNSGSRFSKGCDRDGTRRKFAFTLNSLTKRTGRLYTAQRNANKF